MTTATKTPPADSPVAAKTDLGWVEIPKGSKPSRAAAGPNDGRPVLSHGHVGHTDDGSFLYATNSFILVELPLVFVGGDLPRRPSLKAREEALPEIAIPHAALKALDASKGRFRLFDGLIEIEGRADLYRTGKDGMQAPNFRQLLTAFDATKEPIGEVGFNPDLMKDVGDALGARHGLRAEFISALRPICITPMATGLGRALQMPIRLNV